MGTHTIQRELFNAVANPLADGLIHGKNDLFFTDGMAGSREAHTMTSCPDDGELLPHCVNIFLTAQGYFKQNVTF